MLREANSRILYKNSRQPYHRLNLPLRLHPTAHSLGDHIRAAKHARKLNIFHSGVRAFADDTAPLSPGDFIGRWMSLIAPAAERIGPREGDPTDYLTRLELATVENSLKNLMTFPCVRILVERGKLQLHGAYFGVATGVLLVRDPETGAFKPAVEEVPERISLFSARDAETS